MKKQILEEIKMKKTILITFTIIFISAVSVYADVPNYSLQTFLPMPNCLSVDMSPDGSTIVAGGYAENNNGYRLFDASTYSVVKDFRPGLVTWTWRFSSDSQYLWTAEYYGGLLSKIDAQTGEKIVTIDLGNWTLGVTFDSQRRYLFVSENCPYGGAVGSIKKVDTQTNQVVGSITLNGTPDHCKVISPDGTYIYVASIYDYVYKIQTSDLTVISSIYSNGIGGNNALSLSPSGDRLYVQTCSTNQVHIFDTSTMSELQSLILPCISSGFYVSPDGSYALMSEVGTSLLDVYSLATGSILKKIDLSAYNSMAQYGISAPYWDIDNGRVLCVSSEGIAVLIPEPDPIQEILDFIEESVSDGTLVPVKEGKAGQGQLGALVNMIEAAGNLIDANDPNLLTDICGQLNAALGKTDGRKPPPDFVTGPASPQLAQMIQDLMVSLGCE